MKKSVNHKVRLDRIKLAKIARRGFQLDPSRSDWLVRNKLALIAGPGNSYKTTAALALLLNVINETSHLRHLKQVVTIILSTYALTDAYEIFKSLIERTGVKSRKSARQFVTHYFKERGFTLNVRLVRTGALESLKRVGHRYGVHHVVVDDLGEIGFEPTWRRVSDALYGNTFYMRAGLDKSRRLRDFAGRLNNYSHGVMLFTTHTATPINFSNGPTPARLALESITPRFGGVPQSIVFMTDITVTSSSNAPQATTLTVVRNKQGITGDTLTLDFSPIK